MGVGVSRGWTRARGGVGEGAAQGEGCVGMGGAVRGRVGGELWAHLHHELYHVVAVAVLHQLRAALPQLLGEGASQGEA